MFVAHGPTSEDGLRLVRELLADLVLLDVMLPDTSGYEVCLKIKSDILTSRIPVIFLSARGDVFDKVRGLSSGAVDYLTKPFHPAELLARVDAVLRHAETEGPRLAPQIESGAEGRPQALVLVADDERRGRIEAKLRDHFDVAAAVGTQEVDLVIVEEGRQSPNVGDATVLHLSGTTDDVARIDAELVRIADLAARQRTLRSDLKAATEALIVMAKALEEHDRSSPAHGEQTADRAVALARALHLDEDAQSRIRMGAQLRDIGYARLPAEPVRILQEAVVRGHLDAAVVAALATIVREEGA